MIIPSVSAGQEINHFDVKLQNESIFVSFSVVLGEKSIHEIKEGVEKELKFYIDLFRVWRIWPDEFVRGKMYLRTLKSDPIKKENVALSNEGNVIIEKRFKTLKSMLNWTLSVNDLKLSRTDELEPGTYFIKVTVESKVRKLPPLIGYFLVFLPENEFKVTERSSFFVIGGDR
jgi:hypothetical protein